mgnify:FL=1
MDLNAIANSTFSCKNSVMGLHKLLLTEEEHKALTDALKNHEKLKKECARHKHAFADLWKSHQHLRQGLNFHQRLANGEGCE